MKYSLSNQINKESWFAFKRLSTCKETLHVDCYKQYVLVFFREPFTAKALRLHLPSGSCHNGSLTKAPSQNLAQRMSWQQWAICYQRITTCWLSLAHTFAPYWKWSEEVLQTTYGEGTDVLPGYTVLLVRRRATLKYLHVQRFLSHPIW